MRALASVRWMHVDGELSAASEVVNPGLRGALARLATRLYESPRFAVFARDDGALVVLHSLEPARIDNDLAELVASELVRPGRVAIPHAFERCFTGVVLSSAPDPREAWRAFYDNTLLRLRQASLNPLGAEDDYGPVAVFGRIYAYARGLVAGSSLLDVGTCFGFFPLLLQRLEPQVDVVALDVSAPILELARVAASRGAARTATFVHGDARSLPFADDSFDTVTCLHVLEHLAPSAVTTAALGEMCRVARRRVVVAVPLEEEADPAFDHRQSFDREALITLGEESGWNYSFEDYLGGWLVLEPSRASFEAHANASGHTGSKR